MTFFFAGCQLLFFVIKDVRQRRLPFREPIRKLPEKIKTYRTDSGEPGRTDKLSKTDLRTCFVLLCAPLNRRVFVFINRECYEKKNYNTGYW
ncbi:MAG: hypothetical protein A2079_02970 [Geobacteraceae bacterium GWC2_48_7]|nr:MAG: hypothetical protein A2079_02970 [Geobacteraceae bacterium GWC2_48_7]